MTTFKLVDLDGGVNYLGPTKIGYWKKKLYVRIFFFKKNITVYSM